MGWLKALLHTGISRQVRNAVSTMVNAIAANLPLRTGAQPTASDGPTIWAVLFLMEAGSEITSEIDWDVRADANA